jgi:hypothetical protein
VQKRQKNSKIRRERKHVGADQRVRGSQNYQERPGQKYPSWSDSASVDGFFYLCLFEIRSICTASLFGKILESFPSRRNFAGCNFTVNRSCGILNI